MKCSYHITADRFSNNFNGPIPERLHYAPILYCRHDPSVHLQREFFRSREVQKTLNRRVVRDYKNRSSLKRGYIDISILL